VPNYYYEVIEVRATRAGNCSITSNSSVDTYGSIHTDSFDPSYPSWNLLTQDDDGGGNQQFKLTVFLQPWTTYLLVATTFSEYVTGAFSISTSCPANVNFARRTAITSITTTTTTTTTTTSKRVRNQAFHEYLSNEVGQYPVAKFFTV
jgi:hypothetical protein